MYHNLTYPNLYVNTLDFEYKLKENFTVNSRLGKNCYNSYYLFEQMP